MLACASLAQPHYAFADDQYDSGVPGAGGGLGHDAGLRAGDGFSDWSERGENRPDEDWNEGNDTLAPDTNYDDLTLGDAGTPTETPGRGSPCCRTAPLPGGKPRRGRA
jgi:hypothetical protein